MRTASLLATGMLSAVTAALIGASPASAVVGATPASWTPNITSADSTVRQLVQCNSTMYAVGEFTAESQGGINYSRKNAFSFSASTGAVTSWNPAVNGKVNSIGFNSSCTTAYLGGTFTSAGGAAAQNIAAVSTSTGALVTTFMHSANAQVQTVQMVNGGADLLVGGYFTSINGTSRNLYASLSPSTGAVTNYLNITVAGRLPPDAGAPNVYNQQLSPQGNRLLFTGNFTSVSGQPRRQVVELDLGSTAATLDPWHDNTLNVTECARSQQFYGQAAAFSPDQQTIYLAATGYQGTSPYCDAVTAFTNTPTAVVKWINKTGGDSLYSVAAGPSNVYIGGHQRWADNPQGSDTCVTTCVPRPGIGAIGATSGRATSWNPTRSRGRGADDLVTTPAGLWIASDTYFGSVKCAGIYHPGICFFPGAA